MSRQQEIEIGRLQVELWNATRPIGTRVRYWPGVKEGPGTETITRSRAVMHCYHGAVWVTGYGSSIALSHVEPIDTSPPADLALVLQQRDALADRVQHLAAQLQAEAVSRAVQGARRLLLSQARAVGLALRSQLERLPDQPGLAEARELARSITDLLPVIPADKPAEALAQGATP